MHLIWSFVTLKCENFLKTFSPSESWCHGNNEDMEYNRVWWVRVEFCNFCSLQFFYTKMSNKISFCLLHIKNVNRKIFHPVVFSRSVSHGRGMSYIWSDDLMWDCPGLQRYMFLSPWPGRTLSSRHPTLSEPRNKESGQICQSLLYKHTNTPTETQSTLLWVFAYSEISLLLILNKLSVAVVLFCPDRIILSCSG